MAVVLLALATLAACPASARDRTRIVAGWTVSDVSEQDGGRLVTLVKSGRGWKLYHHFALWHGNGGVYVGATFAWGDCRAGDADYRVAWGDPGSEALTARIRTYMDECRLSPKQQRMVLRGLGPALAQAQRWIEDFRQEILARDY